MTKIVKMPGLEMFHIKAMLPYWEEMSDVPMETSPYRIIAVLPDTSLVELGALVLHAFEFENDHMYGFFDNFRSWYRAKTGYEFQDPNSDGFDDDFGFFANHNANKKRYNIEDFEVGDIFTRKGKKWLMLFDYGDEWNFWVSLMDKVKIDPTKKYSRIVESKFDAPEQYPDYDENDF